MKTLSFIKKTLPLVLICNFFSAHGMHEYDQKTKNILIQLELHNKAPQSWESLNDELKHNIFFDKHSLFFNDTHARDYFTKNNRINLKDNYGDTLVLSYLREFKNPMPNFLWLRSKYGADFTIRNNNKDNALMILVHKKPLEETYKNKAYDPIPYIKDLLDLNIVDLMTQDKDNKTTHMKALEAKNIKAFELLLEKAPDAIFLQDKNGDTVVEYAIRANIDKKIFAKIIQMMVKQNKVPSLTSILRNQKDNVYSLIALYAGIIPTENDIIYARDNNITYINIYEKISEKYASIFQNVISYYLNYQQGTVTNFLRTIDYESVSNRIIIPKIALWQSHKKTISCHPDVLITKTLDYCEDWNLIDQIDAILTLFHPTDEFRNHFALAQKGLHYKTKMSALLLYLCFCCCYCFDEDVIKIYEPLEDQEKQVLDFYIEMKSEKSEFAKAFVEKFDNRMAGKQIPETVTTFSENSSLTQQENVIKNYSTNQQNVINQNTDYEELK